MKTMIIAIALVLSGASAVWAQTSITNITDPQLNQKLDRIFQEYSNLNTGKTIFQENLLSNVTEVGRIRDQVSEIRRDQLNYKIERDVLKEGFASQLQTITIVLTLLFGIFTVLAYLGIRDIGSLKKEHSDELEKLRQLRTDFEVKNKELASTQQSVEAEYKSLIQTSEKQNARLKILELRAKIGEIMNQGNYAWALENLSVALSLDPKHTGLLAQKASCQRRLGELAGAVSAYRDILSVDPKDINSLGNYLELLLISRKLDEYVDLLSEHRKDIEALYHGNLIKYFLALELYQRGDVAGLKKVIEDYLAVAGTERKQALEGWDFYEVRSVLSAQSESVQKRYLMAFISVINGEVSPVEAQTSLV